MLNNKTVVSFFLLLTLISCNSEKIEPDKTLSDEIKKHLSTLGLLEKNEKIIKYYSNFEKDKAGSFFTDKRIAHYWIDKQPEKTNISSAFYSDISSLDTNFNVFDFDLPYLTVKKKDSTAFNLYIEGENKAETKKFFEDAIEMWKKMK